MFYISINNIIVKNIKNFVVKILKTMYKQYLLSNYISLSLLP